MTEDNDLERTGSKWSQLKLKSVQTGQHHDMSVREVRVRSETSSLAPISFVKQKWECLE